jgi:DNA polymerase III epsilon subunit-like protein
MFIFLDTETTGNGPADRNCQIAFKIEGGYTVNELFNPGMPISIDAMTVHHITNEMVLDKPIFRDSDTWRKLLDLVNSNGYVTVSNHDINDAFAVLWSAERIYRREAEVIPAGIESDSVGLRMGIWY